MAIKDQCNNCKLFDGNICRAHNTLPNYNQTSCEGYSKKGINLDKKEDSSIMSDSAFHQPKGNNSNTNSTTLIPKSLGCSAIHSRLKEESVAWNLGLA